MKAYRASATGCGATAATPKEAAEKFFNTFPTKRKCNIIEGKADGNFFTVAFGRASEGQWPEQWKDVTKKKVSQLP